MNDRITTLARAADALSGYDRVTPTNGARSPVPAIDPNPVESGFGKTFEREASNVRATFEAAREDILAAKHEATKHDRVCLASAAASGLLRMIHSLPQDQTFGSAASVEICDVFDSVLTPQAFAKDQSLDRLWDAVVCLAARRLRPAIRQRDKPRLNWARHKEQDGLDSLTEAVETVLGGDGLLAPDDALELREIVSLVAAWNLDRSRWNYRARLREILVEYPLQPFHNVLLTAFWVENQHQSPNEQRARLAELMQLPEEDVRDAFAFWSHEPLFGLQARRRDWVVRHNLCGPFDDRERSAMASLALERAYRSGAFDDRRIEAIAARVTAVEARAMLAAGRGVVVEGVAVASAGLGGGAGGSEGGSDEPTAAARCVEATTPLDLRTFAPIRLFFYGSPGSGKTWLTVKSGLEICGGQERFVLDHRYRDYLERMEPLLINGLPSETASFDPVGLRYRGRDGRCEVQCELVDYPGELIHPRNWRDPRVREEALAAHALLFPVDESVLDRTEEAATNARGLSEAFSDLLAWRRSRKPWETHLPITVVITKADLEQLLGRDLRKLARMTLVPEDLSFALLHVPLERRSKTDESMPAAAVDRFMAALLQDPANNSSVALRQLIRRLITRFRGFFDLALSMTYHLQILVTSAALDSSSPFGAHEALLWQIESVLPSFYQAATTQLGRELADVDELLGMGVAQLECVTDLRHRFARAQSRLERAEGGASLVARFLTGPLARRRARATRSAWETVLTSLASRLAVDVTTGSESDNVAATKLLASAVGKLRERRELVRQELEHFAASVRGVC